MGHRHLHWPASTSTQYLFSCSRSPFLLCSFFFSPCLHHPSFCPHTPKRPFLPTNKHKYTSCHSWWSIVRADCFTLALTGCNESSQSEQIHVRAARPRAFTTDLYRWRYTGLAFHTPDTSKEWGYSSHLKKKAIIRYCCKLTWQGCSIHTAV